MTTTTRTRAIATTVTLAAVTITTLLVGLSAGSLPVSVAQLLGVFTGAEQGFIQTVVLEWRLPRIVAALAIGACLGLSGALLQTASRNPLASPDLIGISGGSYTAVLVLTVLGGAGWSLVGPAALTGGLVTAGAVFLLSGALGSRADGRFLLAGVAVAALLGGVNSWLVQSASLDSAMSAAVWGAGSLGAATWSTVVIATVTLLFCGAYCLTLVPRVRVHALGEDLAGGLGAAPARLRLELLALSVLAVSVATALCGPIGLLPLVAPPIARACLRTPTLPLAGSAAVGAVLLAVSDQVAQHALPGGLPAGLVTTVVGGGYLLVTLIRDSGSTRGARG